eukprot:scaffold421397_cov61-Attheya_sp.AAC.2
MIPPKDNDMSTDEEAVDSKNRRTPSLMTSNDPQLLSCRNCQDESSSSCQGSSCSHACGHLNRTNNAGSTGTKNSDDNGHAVMVAVDDETTMEWKRTWGDFLALAMGGLKFIVGKTMMMFRLGSSSHKQSFHFGMLWRPMLPAFAVALVCLVVSCYMTTFRPAI